MKNVCVREMNVLAKEKHKRPSSMIEVYFKYEGLPESKDSSQLMHDGTYILKSNLSVRQQCWAPWRLFACISECGKKLRTLFREYGWVQKGKR